MSGLGNFLGEQPEDEREDVAAPLEREPEAEREPEQAPEPEPEGEDEHEEPAPGQPTRDGRTVPLTALESERSKRHEQRERAVRAETERDELRKQLEAARQGGQQRQERSEQAAPDRAWPNPVENPAGYAARVQEEIVNERLNMSEAMARSSLGAEKVDAAVAEFQAAAKGDPALLQKLYTQPHPYDWMVRQVETLRLQREIGEDPTAYRARIRAEIEAEVNAKFAQTEQPGQTLDSLPAPRTSPAAGMQPSLARARSVASRTTVDDSDMPLGDILRR